VFLILRVEIARSVETLGLRCGGLRHRSPAAVGGLCVAGGLCDGCRSRLVGLGREHFGCICDERKMAEIALLIYPALFGAATQTQSGWSLSLSSTGLCQL
jgi:hypothetical protein